MVFSAGFDTNIYCSLYGSVSCLDDKNIWSGIADSNRFNEAPKLGCYR